VAPPLAVLDTCVLYPRTTRDLLLDYAIEGLFEPLWSEEILEELRRTCVRRNNPVDGGAGLIAALGKVFPDALGAGYQGLVPALVLPDPDDRHVLALALHHEAEFLVTANLTDFPAPLPGGIVAISADDFLSALTDEMPDEALAAATCHRMQRRLDSMITRQVGHLHRGFHTHDFQQPRGLGEIRVRHAAAEFSQHRGVGAKRPFD